MKNAYLDPLIELADGVTEDAKSIFLQLTPEQLNWKPNKNDWSVGQCFDHLMTTNKHYSQIFRDLAAGEKKANFWENMPLLPGFFGSSIKKACDPNNAKKIKTMAPFKPTSSDVRSTIVQEFIDFQEELLDLVKKTDSLDHENLTVTSPVAKFITYSLKDCCTIVLTHERRHVNQAKAVMELAEFPKDSVTT